MKYPGHMIFIIPYGHYIIHMIKTTIMADNTNQSNRPGGSDQGRSGNQGSPGQDQKAGMGNQGQQGPGTGSKGKPGQQQSGSDMDQTGQESSRANPNLGKDSGTDAGKRANTSSTFDEDEKPSTSKGKMSGDSDMDADR